MLEQLAEQSLNPIRPSLKMFITAEADMCSATGSLASPCAPEFCQLRDVLPVTEVDDSTAFIDQIYNQKVSLTRLSVERLIKTSLEVSFDHALLKSRCNRIQHRQSV